MPQANLVLTEHSINCTTYTTQWLSQTVYSSLVESDVYTTSQTNGNGNKYDNEKPVQEYCYFGRIITMI